jgi:hypothetical protein
MARIQFSDKGTKILVLLRQYEQSGLSLTGDTNNVAIVNNDDTVQLYHGATIGNWTPKHYEETYQAFLDKKNESKQDNASSQEDSSQKSKESVELAKKNYDMKVIAGITVLCLILILVVARAYIKKKRGNRS